jgi:hypothetical protein
MNHDNPNHEPAPLPPPFQPMLQHSPNKPKRGYWWLLGSLGVVFTGLAFSVFGLMSNLSGASGRSDYIKTYATITDAEPLGFLDDCSRFEGKGYQVNYEFTDQYGDTYTGHYENCYTTPPSNIGFDKLEVAYDPNDPSQVILASELGFGRQAIILGLMTVVLGFALMPVLYRYA